jgi:hypothetical protein
MLPFGYYDLIEQFGQGGCPICHLLTRDIDRFLDALLYEFVNEPSMQNDFRHSRGLCNSHGWQITKQRNILSIAVLYHAVLDEVIQQATSPQRINRFSKAHPVADALEPKAPCPACVVESENEARYIQILAEHLEDAKLQSAYRASDGLCLEHFKLAVRQMGNPALLVEIQTPIWRQLQQDLQGFIRKYDVNQAETPDQNEKDSPQRTLARISGERGMSLGRRTLK